MQNSKQTSTIFTLPFIEIFFVNFALQLGQFMMNTLIPKYAHYLGSGEVVIGFVASVFSLAALAARPVSGPAIVSVRKNTLLRITILVITVSIFIYSRSTTIPMLITGRIIHGIFSGISAPLALSMASEYLPEDKMVSGISIFTLGQALATAIGPNLAISLSGAIGYSKAFLIGCAITAASFLLTFFLPDDSSFPRLPFKVSLDNIFAKELIMPAAMMALFGISYGCVHSYLAIYGELLGVGQIGLFFTVYAVVLIFSRPISGKLADKYGTSAAMIPAFILFAAAYVLISSAKSLPIFIIAGIIAAFGYGTVSPMILSLGMCRLPNERRGVAANSTYIGMDVGFFLGGPISGFVCETAQKITGSQLGGYVAMYRIMIIPIMITLVIYLIDRRLLKKSTAK